MATATDATFVVAKEFAADRVYRPGETIPAETLARAIPPLKIRQLVRQHTIYDPSRPAWVPSSEEDRFERQAEQAWRDEHADVVARVTQRAAHSPVEERPEPRDFGMAGGLAVSRRGPDQKGS